MACSTPRNDWGMQPMTALSRRTTLKAVAAAGVSTFGLADFSHAAEELRIGAQVPLTGPLNVSGQQYHFSLQLAQDDINAKGGIAGRPLKVVFEDTQNSNAVAVNAYIKLVKDLKPPFLFLSSYTTHNLASEPEIAKAGIPCVYAGGGDAVHERKNKWMFRIRPNDGIQALAIARFVIDDLKAKKVGILYIQNDFGQGAALAAEKIMKDAGLQIVAIESYGASDKDMSAQLLKIKNGGAEAFCTVSYGADGSLIIKQAKQLGFAMPMVCSSGVMVPAAVNLMQPDEVANLHGIIDTVLTEARGPKGVDYSKRFLERFKVKADPFGACYYDSAWMLKEAVEKVGTDPEKLRNFFASIKDWDGVTHTYTTDALNNMVHSVAIAKFKPGTTDITYVKTIKVA
jgi:branched-chain amino acid transport system substrate-binding protein